MSTLQSCIERTYTRLHAHPDQPLDQDSVSAVEEAIGLLDRGELRVAQKQEGRWIVHEWLKQAILLFFRIRDNQVLDSGYTRYFDKIPLKYAGYGAEQFRQKQVRVAPNAGVRTGAFLAANVVIMPSWINIGAYIDTGSMIDTWSTVGSCAQIGKYVHLSGGVGIGGVLEPLQDRPTIIEDHCFIGARSEIVEGVIVEENSVIGMGVFIGQSTPIYDRRTDQVIYGRVPAGSVVLAGSLPSKTGHCQLNCAVIVKQVDQKTREKTTLNALLRDE